MKIKAALFAVALMAAMLALPVSRATAMPRLDPDIVKTEPFNHIEKAWWRYYYRPHYYHRYHYYRHYHYYHRWHHYRRWHHWHRRYWW
ncbi:MAG: hypothetical protein ABSD90_14115 [Methylocystis sp.]